MCPSFKFVQLLLIEKCITKISDIKLNLGVKGKSNIYLNLSNSTFCKLFFHILIMNFDIISAYGLYIEMNLQNAIMKFESNEQAECD